MYGTASLVATALKSGETTLCYACCMEAMAGEMEGQLRHRAAPASESPSTRQGFVHLTPSSRYSSGRKGPSSSVSRGLAPHAIHSYHPIPHHRRRDRQNSRTDSRPHR